MKKKAVTIYDIAQRLGLSPSTISRALRSDHRINANTIELVNKAAREMNYQSNRVAAGLRGGSTRTIGIMVPLIARQFFANAISGISEVARQRGFQVVITQCNEKLEVEKENVAALTSARVDGIIASLGMETKNIAHFDHLLRRHFPLVFFDRVVMDAAASRVTVTDEDSAYAAVRHLIDGGAQRIAHLSGPEHINIYQGRQRGYQRALAHAGLEEDPELRVPNCLVEDRGYEAGSYLMQLAQPPDAVFSASDFSALGFINYCRTHGIAVPGDVSIVGFANEPFTKIMHPELSSVEQFSGRMGTAAAELLFEQIDSEETEPSPRHIVIEGELRIRTSSSPKASVTVPQRLIV